MWFWIVHNIIIAYITATTVFLLKILFLKASRKRKHTFLNQANLIIVFVLLLSVIFLAETFVGCLQSSNNSGNCFYRFFGMMIPGFMFQTVFFVKRNRTNVPLTILSLVLLTVVYNFEGLVVFITSLYKDYKPSGWSIYHGWTDELWTVLFSVVYFLVCWRPWQINRTESNPARTGLRR